MKKIIAIVTLLIGFGAYSQKEVPKKVNGLIAQNVVFKPYSVLSALDQITSGDLNKALKKSTVAQIKMQSLADLVASKQEYIEVQIPYQGKIITVQLYKVNLFAEGFHIDTDKAKSIPYEQGVYYRGIVKGDSSSTASFNFFKNEMNGIISNGFLKNLVIGKMDKKDNLTDYIIYSDDDLKVLNNIECHTKDEAIPQSSNVQRTTQRASARCATMYFEIDNNLFLDNGSNTTTTSNWMSSVFNNVQTLYSNDGISISLKSLYIWTTPDPYEGVGTKSIDYLNKFNAVRPVFDGDVGQLVGEDAGSMGGLARTIGGLCTDYNYSYADANFSYNTVPTFSWTVQVIAHEMGHLLGSAHTHACVWNGNNTAIDGCGPTAKIEYKEGNCAIATVPAAGDGGTIMSYCHLLPSIGINLANGFGPQPAAAILSLVNSSTCLSTDCIHTCINTVSELTLANVTNTSAMISWTEVANATSWEIAVTPFTTKTPKWISVFDNSYAALDLLPNTYYTVKVHSTCDFGLTPPDRQLVLVTNSDYCNGIVVTDTGGATGEYTDSETYVRTIIPNIPNRKIKLTFSSFDLEQDFDYLYVYDGNSTSATDLKPEGFTGTIIPGPFESTAADGSLTFKFYSDSGVVAPGYVANIDCVATLGNSEFIPNIDFTYFPNPSNGSVTITSKTIMKELFVYNPEGQLLYHTIIDGMNTKADISSFATGTYFFKLKFDEKEVNFKILKM
ncbi:M12 family metallo-peptidase [Flavobacterium psychrotolerans]|uniref:Uncharacterized protein n=1 Tax=Flavobacterium psychrotolerans TaxID=2169410 RepID=A0A2U1JN24_9FLAO|nr:M12 family metallo-peptidase [Flavobacterium psychrotolerans]PWA06566.1 hypothetical protein DB895_03890 [Flavobacterium psychrotolerans]